MRCSFGEGGSLPLVARHRSFFDRCLNQRGLVGSTTLASSVAVLYCRVDCTHAWSSAKCRKPLAKRRLNHAQKISLPVLPSLPSRVVLAPELIGLFFLSTGERTLETVRCGRTVNKEESIFESRMVAARPDFRSPRTVLLRSLPVPVSGIPCRGLAMSRAPREARSWSRCPKVARRKTLTGSSSVPRTSCHRVAPGAVYDERRSCGPIQDRARTRTSMRAILSVAGDPNSRGGVRGTNASLFRSRARQCRQ